jgi:hypothetical protein
MNPAPGKDELISIVRRFYPAGVDAVDERYDSSPETLLRLQTLLGAEQTQITRWLELLEQLRQSRHGSIVWDKTYLRLAPAFRVQLQSRYAAMLAISVLAPVHLVYRLQGRAGESEPAPTQDPQDPDQILLDHLAARHFGTSPLPWGDAGYVVHQVSTPTAGLGSASLGECLFGPSE